jgi:simple sugar transport system permease protein
VSIPTQAPSEQTAPADAQAPRRSGWARAADAFFARREASILVVTIALAIYFYFNAHFVSSDNARTLATFIAAPAIIAAGEVMLMISGEIDLSVGQVYAFAPFIVVKLHDGGVPLLLCVLLSLIACTGIGLVNGVVTTVIGVSSFVTTLGMFFLLNGVTLTIAHGRPVDTPGSGTYAKIFGGGQYSEFIWAVAIVIVVQLLLVRTRWGLHTVATGGNRLGASEAGVKVRVVAIRNFMLASGLAGLTGVLESVRITSTDPSAGGAEIMFLAISAAVIGGTLLAGGSGTVIGAFIGATFLGILRDGFTLQGVSAFTFDLILGIAILVAMVVNVYVGRIRRGSIGA